MAEAPRAHAGRFDPRAVSLAAAVAFGLLLSGTSWPLLGAVAAWLALAALVSRGDRSVVPTGLAFCAALAGGAFLFGAGGRSRARHRGSARGAGGAARAGGHLAAGGGRVRWAP